jgi:hypothetical protein
VSVTSVAENAAGVKVIVIVGLGGVTLLDAGPQAVSGAASATSDSSQRRSSARIGELRLQGMCPGRPFDASKIISTTADARS